MTMFLVGSGPAEGLDVVHDQFVEQARKRGTRVLVALLGEQDEVEPYLAGYVEPIQARWPEAEIVAVFLDDEPDAAQNTTNWPDDLEGLAGLVIAGGWTPGYLEALRPRRQVIATLVRRGVPYLGYSAGAMVVSKRAIVGGWRFRGRQIVPDIWGEGLEELELRDGLALIGPGVDVHSDVTSLGRAMAALEKGELGSVVAIDEGTCLVVDPVSGRTSVEGTQRIHWLSREAGSTVVRHESSSAEQQRHADFRRAEQEKAEQERAERAQQGAPSAAPTEQGTEPGEPAEPGTAPVVASPDADGAVEPEAQKDPAQAQTSEQPDGDEGREAQESLQPQTPVQDATQSLAQPHNTDEAPTEAQHSVQPQTEQVTTAPTGAQLGEEVSDQGSPVDQDAPDRTTTEQGSPEPETSQPVAAATDAEPEPQLLAAQVAEAHEPHGRDLADAEPMTLEESVAAARGATLEQPHQQGATLSRQQQDDDQGTAADQAE